ncbi:Chloroperoxidase [Protomyces lactucae-debilis]|uniref:Chloroperoxidase n=1 Tax=Protomyces lactucae-debilis TaxID=2754530 RepID=A0A1Y2FTV0_PROLT|nr:Chloroperoxidase [Protomyces lactucae-debilis]ORY86997.1 Chloroperoxidase [Protomyces lactucae-debilis]
MTENALSAEDLAKRGLDKREVSYTGRITTTFDAAAQLVSNTGVHAFQAPRNLGQPGGDIRGPCPGLNAAANHGYISRDGVTNLQEAIDGTEAVFNMNNDLSGFLSAYSVISDGDPLTQKWSIGGPPGTSGVSAVLGVKPQGLTGSHNKYETDSSPMRGDLYQYNGDNYRLQLSQFKAFYNTKAGEVNPSYTFDDIAAFRKVRFQQSIDENPYFFYGPFTGIAVSQAAFTFIPAFMSNHSAELPNGFLSREVMQSFMSVVGSPDNNGANLRYVEGNERIPDNWYKRAADVKYSVPLFLADALRVGQVEPRILSVGGNLGKVNTYTGVNRADPAGGLANAGDLTQGNNLACFLYQNAQIVLLDPLKQLTGPLLAAVNSLATTYLKVPAACPQIQQYDPSIVAQFPGSKL